MRTRQKDTRVYVDAVTHQRGWLECCAAIDRHRFDCKAEPEKHRRSAGPFLPMKAGQP
jgi:hypothetical protein